MSEPPQAAEKAEFRSVFWDDYADDLAGLDKRQRRRVLRRAGRIQAALEAAPLWCDEHMEPYCPRHHESPD